MHLTLTEGHITIHIDITLSHDCASYELREDGCVELREDGSKELREQNNG